MELANFSDEELRSELERRGITTGGSATELESWRTAARELPQVRMGKLLFLIEGMKEAGRDAARRSALE